jgi:TorA maturation chaperone TorD
MDELTICKQRKKIYELLSYCLLNVPTKDSLQIMIKGQEILKELIEDSGSEYLIELSDLKKYEQEYYDRFFVPTSTHFIPPYESAIRNRIKNGEKTKFGKLETKETFHVKACYEMVSFNPQNLTMFKPLKDIQFPDHIAYEMSFMTFLVGEEEKSLKKNPEKALRWQNLERQFLSEHLNKWIADYARLLEKKSKGLYSYWLNLCAIWIKEDISQE